MENATKTHSQQRYTHTKTDSYYHSILLEIAAGNNTHKHTHSHKTRGKIGKFGLNVFLFTWNYMHIHRTLERIIRVYLKMNERVKEMGIRMAKKASENQMKEKNIIIQSGI